MTAPTRYPVGEAKLDLRQPIFTGNREAWTSVLDRFYSVLEQARIYVPLSHPQAAHSGRAVEFTESLTIEIARDRVALILDHDSPFLELSPFAGYKLDSTPSASIVAGIGNVWFRCAYSGHSGTACMIIASIPTVKGGSWNTYTILKHNRATQIATENRLPVINLVQAAGVYLPQQFSVFHRAGEMFRDLARRSQNGQSSCSVVFGSSTAGGAYVPGLSDYTIFVRNKAQAFLGGPPLVKMAIGEIIDAESLGGAEMHATVTGLADQIAIDEFDAIRKAREWVMSLPRLNTTIERQLSAPLSPRFSSEDLLSLVNPDIRKPFDMGEVVLRLVDDSRIMHFKPKYGKNLLTSWAEIHGHPVGIIGNNTPVIHGDEALKGTQFIRLCNQRNIPIIYLHNVTGFMVGSQSERNGIIKKGAQFVAAVSCSKVPQISIIIGSSYGAGNYAMCGRAYQPRFLFTWPSGRCSVMGPDQLAGVMEIVQSKQTAPTPEAETGTDSLREKTRRMVENDSESYYTSAHLLDDGIIDPRDTRDILGMCLDVVSLHDIRGAQIHKGLARL